MTAAESGETRKLNEERVKRLTGGDATTARFLYKEHFEFVPQFKLWLAANDKPIISGVDHGIWRRVLLVPFHVSVPAAEQDRALPARLRAEAAGILRWLVEGCAAWQRDGLQPPTAISMLTSAWRDESNPVRQFVDERCVRLPAARVKSGTLYAAYRAWCAHEGIEVMDHRQFGRRLSALGFCAERTNRHGRLWRGVDLHACMSS